MTKYPPSVHQGKLTLHQKAQIVKYAAQQIKRNNVETASWATKAFNMLIPLHPSTVGQEWVMSGSIPGSGITPVVTDSHLGPITSEPACVGSEVCQDPNRSISVSR